MSDVSKKLRPGAALSTLFFGYDEIPLDRLGDEDDAVADTQRAPDTEKRFGDARRPMARCP